MRMTDVGRKKKPFSSTYLRFVGWVPGNYSDKRQVNKKKTNESLTHASSI